MKWVAKTSSVRVSDQRGDRVYQSIDEVPEELRERIEKSIEEPAQTILIANPEAMREIESAAEEMPDSLRKIQDHLSGEGEPRPSRKAKRPSVPASPTGPDIDWRILLGAGLTAIASLWALWIWSIRSGM